MITGKAFSSVAAGLALISLAACSGSADDNADVAAADSQAGQPVIERMDPALDGIIAPGTNLEVVADGFDFTEGPMWRDGRLWFSDLKGNTVYAVTPDGEKEVLIEKAGGYPDMPAGSYLGPNAMVPDKDGTVLLVQQGGRTISRVGADMTPKPVVTSYDGKSLNSPNDLVFGPDGALWFTDPTFGLLQGDDDPRKEQSFNGVYRYADGKVTAAITDLGMPNGIAISPDGKTLYVNNYGPDMKLMAYDIGSDGKVSNGRALITYTQDQGMGGPDGLKVDSAGNIWATGPGGIRIMNPEGKVLGFIKMPTQTTNLAFGGDDGKSVYITSSGTIYRLQSQVAGSMPRYSDVTPVQPSPDAGATVAASPTPSPSASATPKATASASPKPEATKSSTPKPSPAASASPKKAAGADPALALIEEHCTMCHGTQQVFMQRKTADGWAQTVSNMVARGADLSAAEQAKVTQYLAKNYPAQ